MNVFSLNNDALAAASYVMSMRLSAKIFFCFSAFVVFMFLVILRATRYEEVFGTFYDRRQSQKASSAVSSPKVVIVMWYRPLKKRTGERRLPGCNECLLTENRTKLEEPGTKVVLMHFAAMNLEDIPKHRRKDHLYTWWGMESPLTLRNRNDIHLEALDGMFNISMTHRRDSDVWNPYGTFFESYMKLNPSGKPKTEAQLDVFIKEKTHLALWVVSNCDSNKGATERLRYAKQMMSAGLNLTFGGRCSGSAVRRSYDYTRFKFYLSFENSWGCKDYITEKFWKNALTAGAVPVVLGAPKVDYEAVAPPGSFIYAQNFAAPKDLVKHLQYLDRNHEAYKKYLRWTTLDVARVPAYQKSDKLCYLCKLAERVEKSVDGSTVLTLNTTLSKFNYSVAKWLYETENDACFS